MKKGTQIVGLAGLLVLGSGTFAGCSSKAAGASTLGESTIPRGAPIANLPAKAWQWVPIDGAICRDGSPTGIGVNLNPASKNLVIFLEGGGACFNILTCGMNSSHFGMSDFETDSTVAAPVGILSRTDPKNPVADWNMVYVPFCTGDVHAGSATDVEVTGVPGKQQFVGYENITKDLSRLVPTFPDMQKVLLTGISGGGFGADANYPQVAEAFSPVPVYEIDDSGPPMEDPYVPKCLQQQWVQLWGFDKTILKECGADCPDRSNFTVDEMLHLVRKYPNVPFGLIEDTADQTITSFYGFGASDCTSFSALTEQTFTAGLLDARAKFTPYPNMGAFLFEGMEHTTLSSAAFDTRTAGGDGNDAGTATATNLTDWVAAVVNGGTVSNVGP